MRSRRWVASLWFGLGALVGCGDDAVVPDAAPERVVPRPENPTCLAPPRPAGTGVKLELAFPSLPLPANPTALVQPPGDPGRWYVAEKAGRLRVFTNKPDAAALGTALDLSGVAYTDGDVGLLAVAFPPDFVSSGVVYAVYDAAGGPLGHRSRVSRFFSADGGETFDPGTEEVLLEVDQNDFIHSIADAAFGPDGYLYVGLGDGGPQSDPFGRGQDPFELRGKILRLDVSGPGAYTIPADNPFLDGSAREEIWASGFRNPWRMGFDRQTGDLWVGDVGYGGFEEVDVVVRGGNHGWAVKEGFECLGAPPCDVPGGIDPVHAYAHGPGAAVIGGRVYRGTAVPALAGRYVFADYPTGQVWMLPPGTAGGAAEPVVSSGVSPVAFAEDAEGELYLVDHAAGGIYRFAPETPSSAVLPATLAATGCFEAADPARAVPGAIEYGINAPLWSDGLEKRRWLAIPDGSRIAVGPEGDMDLPIGSVVIKEFSAGERRIETRLLVRHDDGGWAGYAYAWNEAGTEATLLEGAQDVDVGGRTWRIPSRTDCQRCHTAAAGRTLGLEVAQLDREFAAPDGAVANQLETFELMGLFSGALPERRRLVAADDPIAPVDDRARSYLHANCAHCHRPGGPGRGGLDFRFETASADVGGCDQPPRIDDLGIADARVIAPGDPGRSVLVQRMVRLDGMRMPPLGTQAVDLNAAGLLSEWVSQISCSASN